MQELAGSYDTEIFEELAALDAKITYIRAVQATNIIEFKSSIDPKVVELKVTKDSKITEACAVQDAKISQLGAALDANFVEDKASVDVMIAELAATNDAKMSDFNAAPQSPGSHFSGATSSLQTLPWRRHLCYLNYSAKTAELASLSETRATEIVNLKDLLTAERSSTAKKLGQAERRAGKADAHSAQSF